MKVGSIVIMVKPFGDRERLSFLYHGITKWPEPSDTPLEVTELIKDECLISGAGIAVDLYPEIARMEIYMDIGLFREVQPPEEINISEIIEETELV